MLEMIENLWRVHAIILLGQGCELECRRVLRSPPSGFTSAQRYRNSARPWTSRESGCLHEVLCRSLSGGYTGQGRHYRRLLDCTKQTDCRRTARPCHRGGSLSREGGS